MAAENTLLTPAPGADSGSADRGVGGPVRSVGWVGAGRMGEAMAERLLDAGIGVAVWNRTGAKTAALQARGATRAATPAEAADQGLLFSMVLDDQALERLWQSGDGILTSTSCRVWIDCSTVSPAASAAAAAAAAAAGIDYAQAPISGNPVAVRAGTAIFAVSGSRLATDSAVPLLNTIGRASYVVGSGAEAAVVKLCTNAVLAVLIETLAEVLILGEKSGVRRADLMRFINDSAVGSPLTRSKSGALVGLDFTPTFTPEGQRKDVRLALDLGARTETPMPLVSATEVAFSRLIAGDLGDGRDYAALILQAARDAGIGLQPEPFP